MTGLSDKVSGTVDVFIQDQNTAPFQYYLMREDKIDITLTSGITAGDSVISVSASHGFTGGEYVVIMENDLYIQTKVASVATDDLTLQASCPYDFTTGATVIRGVIDMTVNGSVTPVDFDFQIRQSTVPIDVQSVHITIWNVSAAGDDGKFGDLAALSNGLKFLKINNPNQGLGNYVSNSDFAEFGGEITYTDKAGGGGTYGVNIDIHIKEHYGIVLRVDPRIGDILRATVKDDLSTLSRLRVSLIGQYTSGE